MRGKALEIIQDAARNGLRFTQYPRKQRILEKMEIN